MPPVRPASYHQKHLEEPAGDHNSKEGYSDIQVGSIQLSLQQSISPVLYIYIFFFHCLVSDTSVFSSCNYSQNQQRRPKSRKLIETVVLMPRV